MQVSPAIAFHLDEVTLEPPPGAVARVVGWFIKNDTPAMPPVRVRWGERAILAVGGLPRPDVAMAYPDLPAARLSGFSAEWSDFTGSEVARMEWGDIDGTWHEFWREPNPVPGGARKRGDRPRILNPAACEALFVQLDAALARPAWQPTDRALSDLVAEATCELTAFTSPAEWSIELDAPSGKTFSRRFIPLQGWIRHPRRHVLRLFAHAEPGGSVYTIFPRQRRDVVSALSVPPESAACGFAGMIKFDEVPPPHFELRLYAETDEGETLLALVRHYRREPPAAMLRPVATATHFIRAALRHNFRPSSWRSILPWTSPRPAAPHPLAPISVAVQPASAKSAAFALDSNDPLSGDPLISILVPVFNPPESYLREMIESVLGQSYPRWELCLADDASTAPHVRPILDEYARLDVRIRPVFRATNGHIARATNTALAEARGEWIALLDHDDLLPPDALNLVVTAMRSAPTGEFFYTNRDKVDDTGRFFDPEQRGAWNPAMAMTHNYLHHLTVIRRQLVVTVGAFRPDYFGSQDLDLYLRCHERLRANQIVYLPVIGYHWRAHAGSTASRGDQKDYMFDSACRSIADAMARRQLRARPFLPAFGSFFGLNLHQLRWDNCLLREQGVTIVLSASSTASTARCLDALAASLAGAPIDIVAVTPADCAVVSAPANLATKWIRVPAHTTVAECYNLGAAHARAPLLLLLDAALYPVSPRWLEDLAGWLSVADVAAAGPKIQTPGGVLSSAGWTTDPVAGLPRPLCAGEAVADLIAPFLSHSARDAWVLDPRCVLVRTVCFRELGGFDTGSFSRHHFMADFCFRLRQHGQRAVFTPQAVMETARENTPLAPNGGAREAEDRRFIQRHPLRSDPWIPAPSGELALSAIAANALPRAAWMPAETVTFAEGWFHLEEPAAHQTISAGHQILSGWCLPSDGALMLELRVSSRDETRRAVYGHPRPDLARAIHATTTEFLPVGFSLVLDLPAGSHSLSFEGFFAGLGWRSIAVVKLVIKSPPAATRPLSPTPLSPEHFQTSLESWLRCEPENSSANLAASVDSWVRPLAELQNLRHAALPFIGYLDQPPPDVVPHYSEIAVAGWLLHTTQPIRRVVASFDPAHWVDLNYGTESRGLPSPIADRPEARCCGFFGAVTIPAHGPNPLTLRVWAQLQDGTWQLAFALRGQRREQPPTDRGTAQGFQTTTLLRAAFHFYRACRRHQLATPSWWRVLALLPRVRHRLPRPPPARLSARSSPAAHRGTPAAPLVVLVTHNLNREGAPLFLLELATFCQPRLGCSFTLVTTQDGELRDEFERQEIPVRIVSRQALWIAQSRADREAAQQAMAAALDATSASLVIANTIESFWAVNAAAATGCPSLFYIHEPGVLGVHYLAHASVELRRAAASALNQATAVSFLSESSQIYYRAYGHGRNHRLQPGWPSLAVARTDLSPGTRAQARHRLGYAPSEKIILSVGTLCPRKGQLFLLQALATLGRLAPGLAAHCRLVIVGTHENAYGERAAAFAPRCGPARVDFVPSTPEVQDYFCAADVFALSSFEEGFSRVLLEAMAFGLPIVATDIHSLGAIARPGRESLLVGAADPHALAVALRQVLEDRELAGRLGRQARERLSATFAAERVLPGHLATMVELAPELATPDRAGVRPLSGVAPARG